MLALWLCVILQLPVFTHWCTPFVQLLPEPRQIDTVWQWHVCITGLAHPSGGVLDACCSVLP